MRSAAAAILLVAIACTEGAPPESPRPGASAGVPPGRIVSLLPSFTEIILALGLRDRLVGVSAFSPEGVEGIRSVGGLADPDLEAILALDPDLVIGMGSRTTTAVRRKIEEAGLPCLFLANETLADALEAILAIGERAGRAGEARALRARIEGEIASVETSVRGARPVRAAIVVQRRPMILAGPGSFLGELLGRAGGENIAADAASPHPQFDLESFAVRAPEVIIDVSGSYRSAAPEDGFLEEWRRLPSTPALETGRIHPLPPGIPINPGPRVAELFRFIASKLHP